MARGPRRAARTILRWPSINCIVQLMRREDLDSPDDYGLLLPLPPPSKGRYVCLHLPELRRRRPRSRMRVLRCCCVCTAPFLHVLRCCCVCTAPFRVCCDAAACALPPSACAAMLLRVHCPFPRVLRCCCVCTAPFLHALQRPALPSVRRGRLCTAGTHRWACPTEIQVQSDETTTKKKEKKEDLSHAN